MNPVFVLVHSPLVGPATWSPVAEELASAGYRARVPSLLATCSAAPPHWPRIAATVLADLDHAPPDTPVVLVAHSNAGNFLPAIRAQLTRPIAASIFVDAALPARAGPTRVATPAMLDFLRPRVVDGRLPRWTDWWDPADVADLFPDAESRHTVTAEEPCLPFAFFEQEVPVPDGWDDHPCAYLIFSPPYEAPAAEAAERGWRVARMPGGHLHQLVDPKATAHQLIALATRS